MEGLIVLVSFTLAFIGIAVWAYLPRNKQQMKAHGEIPFKEDGDDR